MNILSTPNLTPNRDSFTNTTKKKKKKKKNEKIKNKKEKVAHPVNKVLLIKCVMEGSNIYN